MERGHLAIVHSTGFGYTGRSHFEGQDVMQTGIMTPYAVNSGWVGRGMERASIDSGVAISIPMPLILRGNTRATTDFPIGCRCYAPQIPMPSKSFGPMSRCWRRSPRLFNWQTNGMQTRGMGKEAFEGAKSMRGLARVPLHKCARTMAPCWLD